MAPNSVFGRDDDEKATPAKAPADPNEGVRVLKSDEVAEVADRAETAKRLSPNDRPGIALIGCGGISASSNPPIRFLSSRAMAVDLLVFGPHRLPDVARQVGGAARADCGASDDPGDAAYPNVVWATDADRTETVARLRAAGDGMTASGKIA